MLRAFLQHRSNALLDENERFRLKGLAARILERNHESDEALRLYVNVGDIDAARSLILKEAPQLIGVGRWQIVVDWIERLPREQATSDRWLLYWMGTALVAIQPLRSRKALEASYDLATAAKDIECEIQAIAAV